MPFEKGESECMPHGVGRNWKARDLRAARKFGKHPLNRAPGKRGALLTEEYWIGRFERAARCKVCSQAPARAGIERDFTVLPAFALAESSQ